MFGIKKLVFRPRIDDWSPLAKFYYADEALRRVCSELDAVDGSRDPETCQQLIAKYRGYQDRFLQVLDEIMEEVFPNSTDRVSRDFRVKFPDDIIHDTFPGQLWFGAECLAVGSNIVDREFESEALRPLAKILIKKMENLRNALKEQSLKNVYTYPDKIRELLHDFDVVFADFELNYVSAMVPVKTAKEYEMQVDVAVLFSETLIKSIRLGYITQAMIDDCDPSIMFTLPRLAIVSGLLDQVDGPLQVNKRPDQLPEMFRPFKSLLQRIRDLLRTLTPLELRSLERALSSQDGAHPLTNVDQPSSTIATISDYGNREKSKQVVGFLKKNLASALVENIRRKSSEDALETGATSAAIAAMSMDLSWMTVHGSASTDQSIIAPATVSADLDATGGASALGEAASHTEIDHFESDQSKSISDTDRLNVKLTGCSGGSSDETSAVSIDAHASDQAIASLVGSKGASAETETDEADISTVMARLRSEDLRGRFSSPQDLIHRLFVCIAGVADQWQSNYPADLRAILKMVLHSGDVPNIYEVHGKPSKSSIPEEETGVEASENISIDSSSVTADGIGGAGATVPWIPDNECPICVSCSAPFTVVRRRHHCRNCGKIFCSRCSQYTAPLPKYGYEAPVRVCDRCFFYKLTPLRAGETNVGGANE